MQDPKNGEKNRHLGTIAQLCRAISLELRHISTIGKIVKQQYLAHTSPQYGELWLTSGWDRFVSVGHPYKFQRVSRLGSVYCTVLQQRASAKLCGVEQRAPPIFGRATITLGIGPHSSCRLLLHASETASYRHPNIVLIILNRQKNHVVSFTNDSRDVAIICYVWRHYML